MYQKTNWKDHVVQYENRYIETQNPDGSVDHVPHPGATLQEGTDQDAIHFNKLENGVQHTSIAFDYYMATSQAIIRDLESRLVLAEQKLATLV